MAFFPSHRGAFSPGLHHIEDVTAVFDEGETSRGALDLRARAAALWPIFRELSFEEVLGALVRSERIVLRFRGAADAARAEQLATRRIELGAW